MAKKASSVIAVETRRVNSKQINLSIKKDRTKFKFPYKLEE